MIKKILLSVVLLSVVLLFTGCWNSAPYVKPQIAAEHHGDRQFISGTQKDTPLWSYMQMRFREGGINTPAAEELKAIQKPADLDLINSFADKPRVTWLGHASTLVQYQGINFLTDPHLSEYASPVPFMGPKRLIAPALSFAELPKIDFIVISHNHYDHLDINTVKKIGDEAMWLVPLGLKQWMTDNGIGASRVVELDWWQKWQFKTGIEVVATPSQHWSKRTPFDTNHTLWASWHVNISGFKTWFAGDTGYSVEKFIEIGKRLGPHNLSLIPIGAYGPRYFMLPQHVDPEQAIKIHEDVNSEFSVGIHWGTFALTHEPFLEPANLLVELLEKKPVVYPFVTLKIGETHVIDFD